MNAYSFSTLIDGKVELAPEHRTQRRPDDGFAEEISLFTNIRRNARGRRRASFLVLAVAAVPAMALMAGCGSDPTITTTQHTPTPLGTPRSISGTLPDGAKYLIDAPANWNGTLALFSHGLRLPGEENPPENTPSDTAASWLLDAGYAIAGSSYASNGWAFEDGLADQLQTLDVFETQVGKPTRTIAWGESLGGLVSTALVERYPDRFSGAIALCGAVAGGPAVWNTYFDAAFVMKTLLAPAAAAPVVTGVTDPVANATAAQTMVRAAVGTPQGRARLALVAAIAQIPEAQHPGVPVATDLAGRTEARIGWVTDLITVLAFAERGEIEQRAGGNPSSNVGVDYSRLLEVSQQGDDVRALYAQAGLDLAADLGTLRDAPRVNADPEAADYLDRNGGLNGHLTRPVLTMHTVYDGALPTSNERAYAETVEAAGTSDELSQVFVDRAGHCLFTPAELLSSLDAFGHRLDTGTWGPLDPDSLNAKATEFGPEFSTVEGNLIPPAFTTHDPLPYPRALPFQ